MENNIRRRKILDTLYEKDSPISGTELAGMLGVSRQVIVQDIALMRVTNKNILATNKGYILFTDKVNKKRVYKVKHSKDEILDELYTVVDLGGKFLDVIVEHDIYGKISPDLIINNRADAEAFVKEVEDNKTKPLNALTNGVHFHTVIADSEEILNIIGNELNKKGYLII